MNASINVEYGKVTIELSEEVKGRFKIYWGLFWPEKEKNPFLALQFMQNGQEQTIFAKEICKEGKDVALKILDTILLSESFEVAMPGQKMTEYLKKGRDISMMKMLRLRILGHDPK